MASNTRQDLEAVILDAIQTKEEKLLPGLGVLFELIWEQSNEQDKLEMIQSLESGVKEASAH